jgi:hypothetical protein
MKNLSICILLGFAFLISCNNNKNVDIHIVQPIDFGVSTMEDTLKLSTTCINLSKHKVEIDYIKTPCGCIIAIPRKHQLPKNDSTLINIVYKPSETGYIEQNLFLYIKNYPTPFHFVIKGHIKK